jgi:dihydrodipicolinate synthase/N-acetylneuraminate lyase
MTEAGKLGGIVVPLATPLSESGRLDLAGLSRLVEHVIAGGVRGIFVLGTTGEAPGLSPLLRRELIRAVCRQVDGRVPVLAGALETSAEETRSLAGYAAEQGATAMVVPPPYYFLPTQGELLGYFERLIPSLALPVLLYNQPSLTKVAFGVETVRALSALPGVRGIKDSSGDMAYFAAIRRALPAESGFSVFCGPEEFLAEALRLGADGGVCGGANLFPKLYVEACEAYARGDMPAVEHLQRLILNVSRRIYGKGEGSSSYLCGLKCALSGLNLCGDTLAEPFVAFKDPERGRIQDAAREIANSLGDLGVGLLPA